MSVEKRHKELRPERALLHPLWVGALTLLILNDHVLKASELAGWWTGKLSDFAGLFLAPALLAVLLGVRTRGGLWGCAAVVGAIFSGINLSTEFAAMWDGAVSQIWPFATTVDPTDLFALPMLAAGVWILGPVMERNGVLTAKRRMLALAGAVVGTAAGVATSAPPEDCFDCWDPPPAEARVSVLNKSHELQVLRIRYLRNEIGLDCARVWEDPNAYLRDEAFGAAERWLVQSGQEIGLVDGVRNEFGGIESEPNRDCFAALIQSDTVPDILVFWDDTFPSKTFEFDPNIPKEIPADPQTVVLKSDYDDVPTEEVKPYRFRTSCGSRADLCADNALEEAAEIPQGARYFWESKHTRQIHFRRPLVESTGFTQPRASCESPGPGEGLAWEDPPTRNFRVVGIEEGVDGCHELLLERNDQFGGAIIERTWFVCAPIESLEELLPGQESVVSIDVFSLQESVNATGGGYRGLRIEGQRKNEDDQLIESFSLLLTRGFAIPPEVDIETRLALRDQCEPRSDVCGEILLPADIAIPSAGILKPGNSVTFGEVVKRTFYLVRSAYRPVIDRACETHDQISAPQRPTEETAAYIEAVIVRK